MEIAAGHTVMYMITPDMCTVTVTVTEYLFEQHILKEHEHVHAPDSLASARDSGLLRRAGSRDWDALLK